MKKAFKLMSLAAVLVGLSVPAHAQFRQSAYLNFNIPTGEIAKSSDATVLPLYATGAGYDAKVGFGAGYRASYRFDVGVGMVAPFGQIDLFWNTIGSDLSDMYTQAKASNKPSFVNIPIQLGVSYLYDELWSDITPYAEFGLGADMMFIGSEGAFDRTTMLDRRKYSYKPTTAFSFSLGVGAYFGRHVSAGLYYYGFGTHNIEYTKSTYNRLTSAEKALYDNAEVETRSAGSVVLRIGFHF